MSTITLDTQSADLLRKGYTWRNELKPLDVNADGTIAPNDALAVINYINAFGSRSVPLTAVVQAPYLDTSGDDFIAPNDALNVINHINANPTSSNGDWSEFV
jgi:Dockerin type I domain